MTAISSRLAQRIDLDFGPDAPEATTRLKAIELYGQVDAERVLAAVVLWANGDLHRLDDAASLAAEDWRDVLVRAGLEYADWPARLDAALGQASG